MIPPRSDWEFVGYDDLGDMVGNCDLCGRDIRYVFLINHPKWTALEVGEICCDHLTETSIASTFLDSKRRLLDRRKRFVSSRRWSTDRAGIQRIQQDDFNLRVIPFDGRFKLKVNDTVGRLTFPSPLEAKVQAFDLLASGKLAEFFLKKN